MPAGELSPRGVERDWRSPPPRQVVGSRPTPPRSAWPAPAPSLLDGMVTRDPHKRVARLQAGEDRRSRPRNADPQLPSRLCRHPPKNAGGKNWFGLNPHKREAPPSLRALDSLGLNPHGLADGPLDLSLL